jgi:hypothetical protein
MVSGFDRTTMFWADMLYVVVAHSLDAGLARGARVLLISARTHLHHNSRVVSFNQLLTLYL